MGIPTPNLLTIKTRNLHSSQRAKFGGEQRLHQGDVDSASVLPDLEPEYTSRGVARPRALDACSARDSKQERDVYEACPTRPLQPRL